MTSVLPLNILMIGPYPLDENRVVGGVEAVTSILAPALSAQDGVDRITVLAFRDDIVQPQKKQVNDKLQIWYLHRQRQFRTLTRTFLEARAARRAAAAVGATIVHGQGIGSRGDVAIQTNMPAVVTIHGLVHTEARLKKHASLKTRLRTRLVNSRVERVLEHARAVISISNYDAQALGSMVRGQFVSIPNPIAQSFFETSSHNSFGNNLLFAGVMTPRKNVDGLVRAFALARQQVPDARLTIVGPTPDEAYAQKVRQQVATLRLEDAITFVGHVENDRLVQEMRQCRGIVLFSREETAPTTLAQAMALGKPIVATRVGGIPEMVIDGENGFLVEFEDEHACADRMAALFSSTELCHTMGAHGHEIACQRYNPAAVARKTVDTYRAALCMKSNAA